MEEELNDEELEERLYSMLHHVDDTVTDTAKSENALNVIKNAPQSTVRRYWRDDGPRTAPQNNNTPFQRVNNARGGKTPFQNTPRNNNLSYQNVPRANNSSYQNNSKGNNSPFQNNPKGYNSPFQNNPRGINSPFQNTPKGNYPPFQNNPNPRGNSSPYQNTPKGHNSTFQNTPKGNNSSYQNTPKGNNLPYQNTPKDNNSPFPNAPKGINSTLQNTPKGNNSPFQNTPRGNNPPNQNTLKGSSSPFPNTRKGNNSPFQNSPNRNNSSFPNTLKGNTPFQKVDAPKVPQKQNKEVKDDPEPKVENSPEDPLQKHLSIFHTIAPNSAKTIEIIENDEDKAVELMSSDDDDEVIEVALPPKPIISIDSSDDEISVALATPTKTKPTAGKGKQIREVSASPVASIVSSVSDDFIRGDCVAFNISRHPEKHSFDFSLHGADLDVGTPAKKKKKKKNKENATSTPIAVNTTPSKDAATDECFATPKSKAKNKKSKNKQYTVTETSIPNADVYDSDSNQSAIDLHTKNQNSHIVMQTSLPLSDIFDNSNLPETTISGNKSIQNNDVNSSDSSISLPQDNITVNTRQDSQASITIIDLTDNNQVIDNSIQENIVMANVTGFTESNDYHDEIINLSDSRIGSTKVPAILFDDVDFDNLKGPERSGLSKSYSMSTLRSDMQKFYNESWGGEEFSHREVQRSMSRDRSLWMIDMKDKIPMYRRKNTVTCNYCNRTGHRDDTCWKKPPVCFMCGAPGHPAPRCPNKICVNCGSPNNAYSGMCGACAGWSRLVCSQCRRRGHPHTHCDTHWRAYHHTIYNPHMPPPHIGNANNERRGGNANTTSPRRGIQPFRGYTHDTHPSQRRNTSLDNTQRQSKTPTRFEQRNPSLNNSQNFTNNETEENINFNKNKNSAAETVQQSPWNPKTHTQRKSSLNEAPTDKNIESNDNIEVNSTANIEKTEVSVGKKRNISATDYTQHTQRRSKTPSRQEHKMERRKSVNESPSDRNINQNYEQLDSVANEISNEEHIGKKRKISATDNTHTQRSSKTPTREQKKRTRSEDSVENKTEDKNVKKIEADSVTSTEKAPDFIPISNNTDAQGRVIQDNSVTASNTADESDTAPEERPPGPLVPTGRPEFPPEHNIPHNKNKALRKINTALASLNKAVGEPNALHKELDYLQKKHKSLLNQKVVSTTKLQNSRNHIRDIASKLNLILVGQAGLAGGFDHVQELNNLKEQIVQIRNKNIPIELRTAIGKHYHSIFSSMPRNDYWALLNTYNFNNKTETLFNLSRNKKKIYNQKVRHLENEVQTNQVNNEVNNKNKKGEEKSGTERRKKGNKEKIAPKNLGRLIDCWKKLTQMSLSKGKRKGNSAQLARQLHAHIVSLKKNATTSAKNLKKILKIQQQANLILYGKAPNL